MEEGEDMRKKRKKRQDMRAADDPLGSYTGVPTDGSAPVQDADDL